MYIPSVSAIIPAFNASMHVGHAIESIMAQNFEVKELIFVNDGSTDNTLEVLEHYRAKYPEKIKLLSIPNSGASAARNKGLDFSSGDYIQFLDADDVIQPDKIEHQVKLISDSPVKPDMIAGASYRINPKGEKKNIPVNNKPWYGLVSSSLGNTCANLFRREILLQVGGWNETLNSSQEYDLMFNILKNGGHILIDQEPKTIVKDRENSISATNRDKNWDRYIRLRSQILLYLQQEGKIDEELKQFILQEIFNAIRILFYMDKQAAVKWYNEIIRKENFTPHATGATTIRYIFLYRLLGFPLADQVALAFKKGNNK